MGRTWRKRISLVLSVLLLFCAASGTGEVEAEEQGCIAPGDEPAVTETPESASGTDLCGVTVPADTGELSVSVTSMENVNDTFVLMLLVGNKSDVGIVLHAEYAVLNGYTVDPVCRAEVAPGETAEVPLRVRQLSGKGVTDEIYSVEIGLRAFESGNHGRVFLEQGFKLYPLGEEGISLTEREIKSTDIVAVDNDEVTIVVTGFGEGKYSGFTAGVYLVNKTDRRQNYTVTGVSVNGCMADPYWSCDLQPGTRRCSEIRWKDRLKENGTGRPEEIEMTFYVRDISDWSETYRGTVVLNPPAAGEPASAADPEPDGGTVLADTGELYIKAVSMERQDDGFVLNLRIENRSDVSLVLKSGYAVLNGYCVDPVLWSEVTPGKKANGRLRVSRLSEKGVTGEINSVEISLKAHESGRYDHVFLDQSFSLYPLGWENVPAVGRELKGTDIIVADNDDITIVVTGFEESSVFGYAAKVYLVNKTGRQQSFGVRDALVDGCPADPFWACNLPPGTRCYSSIDWFGAPKKDGAGKPESVSMTFEVNAVDSWDTTYSGTVVLTP